MPVAVLKPTTPANPTATTDIYYIHADHLGTPRKITRPNDNRVVWSWESEAFGNSLPDQNPSGLGNFVFNLRFPGQYYDQETGLFYNYFRDYDPAKGRYIESDPIGLAGGINTYGYVGGNPVNRIDPTGKSEIVIGGGVIIGGTGALYCALFPDKCRQAAQACVDAINKMFNEAADKHPSTPTGQRGNELNVKPGSNSPTTIGDRDFTGHALDRMQGRGVPPSAVEDAIQNGQSSPGRNPGTTDHVGDNGVTVVTGENGQVITVIPK